MKVPPAALPGTTSSEIPAAILREAPAPSARVRGLDSIRFICALWVMLGHIGLPYVSRIDRSVSIGFGLRGLLANLVSGPAAVIVFFVISGFCIHFPYRHATSIELFPYFARRHVRILGPVAAAIALGALVGFPLTVFGRTILWSIVCEEIYYTIFPLLLKARTWWGWPRVIAAAFGASYAVVLTNPRASGYPSFGFELNWILGLPCWLLGCHLAQSWDRIAATPAPSRGVLWAWRLGVFAASSICCALRFHSPIGYPWTLNLFALLAFRWLAVEVVWFLHAAPVRLLELGGMFSFSIYLMHQKGEALAGRLRLGHGMPLFLSWPLRCLFILVVCFAFYVLVEGPCHKLARWLYRVLSEARHRRLAAVSGS